MNKQSRTFLGIVLFLGMILVLPMAVKAVEFTDVTNARTGSGYVIKGVLNFNDAPVEQLNVKLFCNGVEKAVVLSGTDGTFRVEGNGCFSNQDSYAQVEYNGQVVETTHMKVPRGKSVHTASITSTSPAGVPEFSLLTLGTAVVAVTLGLVFLRKN